ncbi:primary amine oxidase [Roseibium sp. TrichSKD4]|uniref:copper amine oxidase n=1 Tax=Roseibium sp. TrichSKD4 TaxID=744980 RepID=UPI0001E57675|nr:tyramine oxidase [Roseibium sp. TrichSKD4]EFO30983.1 primary amine oxidase [Roseibium sp. TrichSKD4]
MSFIKSLAASLLAGSGALSMGLSSASAEGHPLDGLTGDEVKAVTSILNDAGTANADTLYPLIELLEPPKAMVLSGDSPDRKATVHMFKGGTFHEAVVNITDGSVESAAPLDGQPMVMFAEFITAMETALGDPRMATGLEKRGLTPDDVFCLPLTAGNFFTDAEDGKRLMKVPCYVNPTGSNFYAKPIEGLFAVVDLAAGEVLDVIAEEPVATPEDDWGYTDDEIAQRAPLREDRVTAGVQGETGSGVTIDGTQISWDIWRMRYRTDKRPGVVLSNIDVRDGDRWRSVLYQAHLSEVFVPYMDPTSGWYWRTYMDSGEYGFGLFLTPLRKGVDCPSYASFLPAMIHDDNGNPLEIPDAICVFERNIGDPAWRHFEVFAQTPDNFVPTEGRPETELVVRSASEVGNYDYLIDYRFKQNGEFYVKIGASGLDAVKGVNAKTLADPSAADDTKYGRLIAPNLVAPYHDHYFNFRLDFDIDSPNNTMMVANIVEGQAPEGSPRKSFWTVRNDMVKSEKEGTFQISSFKPRYFHIMNPNEDGYLGYKPGYMLHHGSVAYGPFDFENDPPFMRNRYIENSVWTTEYKPDERYAGGKLAFASDGSDGLATWIEDDANLVNKDIVTWFTAGFHHIPRMEDWPVMSTEWKTVHMMPMNFFPMNPAITIRTPKDGE